MRRRETHEISKHTVNFFAGDYAKMQRMYGTRVGAAKVIRDIIHAHIRKVEEDAAQRTPPINSKELMSNDRPE